MDKETKKRLDKLETLLIDSNVGIRHVRNNVSCLHLDVITYFELMLSLSFILCDAIYFSLFFLGMSIITYVINVIRYRKQKKMIKKWGEYLEGSKK